MRTINLAGEAGEVPSLVEDDSKVLAAVLSAALAQLTLQPAHDPPTLYVGEQAVELLRNVGSPHARHPYDIRGAGRG